MPRPTLRSAGAILLVSVPATIITSDCRGLARNTMPNLSMSYRDAAAGGQGPSSAEVTHVPLQLSTRSIV